MSSAIPLTRSELIAPFEGSRWSVPSRASVTGARQPLVELATLQSVVCEGVPGLLGYPGPDRCLVVSDGPWWSSTVTVARHLAMPDASSRALRSPSEFLRTVICSCAHASELLPWGLVPLRDISTRSPRSAGHPEPDGVPPAAFRTLSTACSSPCLARLFRRAAVSRVSLQGFVSSDRAAPPRRWPLPSRRWRRSPAGCPAPANVASTSGSCSRPESVVSDEVVHPAVTRVPSCVFKLPRAFHRDLGRAIARPPLAALMVRCCVCPVPVTLSVSISPCASPLSPEAVPVRASWPSSQLPFPRGPSVLERLIATADERSYEQAACQARRGRKRADHRGARGEAVSSTAPGALDKMMTACGGRAGATGAACG